MWEMSGAVCHNQVNRLLLLLFVDLDLNIFIYTA